MPLQDEPERGNASRGVTPSLVVVMVACLLPYVNIGPFSAPSQVQPWAAILAWLWFGFHAIRSGARVTGLQMLLLAFAFYFMVRVYGGQGFDLLDYFRRSATFLLSAGIFLAGQYVTPATLWRALKITIPIWLAFGVLGYIDKALYFTVVTRLVPTVTLNQYEVGTSSLAPEATDFGLTMVAMVALCMITRYRLAKQGIHAEKWPLAGAILCVLISLSGSGYIGLAMTGLIYGLAGPAAKFITFRRVLLVALATVCALILVNVLIPDGQIRGVDLIKTMINDPTALTNTNFSGRLTHLTVGFLGLVDSNFLGFGASAYKIEAIDIYYKYNVENLLGLTGRYATQVPIGLTLAPLSQFALIAFEFGIIGIIYIIIIFVFAFRSRIPYKPVAIAVLFMAWLQSFPAGWPPFWIIIGIMMSPYFVQGSEHEDP